MSIDEDQDLTTDVNSRYQNKKPRYINLRYTQTRKTLTNLMKFLPALLAVNFNYDNVAPKALLRKHTE
jgi:hypothetical protein